MKVVTQVQKLEAKEAVIKEQKEQLAQLECLLKEVSLCASDWMSECVLSFRLIKKNKFANTLTLVDIKNISMRM